MTHPFNALRLNVGFVINLPVGESRDFGFDLPRLNLDPGLDVTSVHGLARITRTAQGLLTHVELHGMLLTECVRCLTDIQVELQVDFTELYAFSRDSTTESNLLLPEDAHINLEPLAREYFLLEIPISPICKNDCKGLCPVCGGNLNETICTHEGEIVESRFSALRSLLEP